MVAGAAKADLLSDLRGAVQSALDEGQTIEQFRKEFDSIVKKRGWKHSGSSAWRARVIYETNLQQSYNAGRYRQQMEAAKAGTRPYLQYQHSPASETPRQHHLAWDGLVLLASDKWWDTNYPREWLGLQVLCALAVGTPGEKGRRPRQGAYGQAPRGEAARRAAGDGAGGHRPRL